MSKLEQFYKRLEKLKKPKSDDPYDNRITHCNLIHEVDGKKHSIEVRSWFPIINGKLTIYIVSWTLCAGTGILTLTEDLVDQFLIEEI